MSRLNDRAVLKLLRTEIDAALVAIGAKHAIKLSVGNCKFDNDGNNAQFQLLAATVTASGAVMTAESKSWNNYRTMYGLGHVETGASFRVNGTEYRITGMNPRAPRFRSRLNGSGTSAASSSRSTR